MKKKTVKQVLFERMNKVAGMPLNENFDSQTERVMMDIIQELQADSDYSLTSNPRDVQWVVQNIMDALKNDNLDKKMVQDYVTRYLQDEERESTPQRGPEAPQKTSPELEKFMFTVKFLGDKMTDEQATQLMDAAKQELSIADRQALLNYAANVSGAMYGELSQHDAEMGGLGRYE